MDHPSVLDVALEMSHLELWLSEEAFNEARCVIPLKLSVQYSKFFVVAIVQHSSATYLGESVCLKGKFRRDLVKI